MNKLLKGVVTTSLAVLAVSLLFSIGRAVTNQTLKTYHLEVLNPNNIMASILGTLLVLALLETVLRKKNFIAPIYEDLLNHLAAGVFKNPHALKRAKLSNPGQVITRLQLLLYPQLKIIACGIFTLFFFTAVFPLPLALLGTIYLAAVGVEVASEGRYIPWDMVVRGFALKDGHELAQKWLGKKTKRLLRWGASFVPKDRESTHYMVIGNTGTGKSLWKETMIKQTIPGNKAIINDPKFSQTDGMIPLIHGLGSNCLTLNLYDYRCTSWWMAKDIKGEGMAYEFAVMLFPIEKKGEGQFFDDAARLACVMIVVSLQGAFGENWTFRQVILCAEKDVFAALIKRYHPRPNEFDEFLKSKKMVNERNDILLTLQTRFLQFTTIAALWERNQSQIAFSDFVQDHLYQNTTLILGSDPIHSEVLSLANSIMFNFAAKYLKALPPNKHRRIWIYLDEAASEKTSPFPEIESLFALGRGAGICICFCFHSISLLKRTYGELAALGLFGLARHKAIFAVDGETSKFLSETIGDYEYVKTTFGSSVSDTPQGINVSKSWNESVERRPTILSGEFTDQNRPPTTPENGLAGYFIAPGEGIHHWHYSGKEIERFLPPRSQDVEAYLRISDDDPLTQLKPFTDDELRSWLPEALERRKWSAQQNHFSSGKHNKKNRKNKNNKNNNHNRNDNHNDNHNDNDNKGN